MSKPSTNPDILGRRYDNTCSVKSNCRNFPIQRHYNSNDGNAFASPQGTGSAGDRHGSPTMTIHQGTSILRYLVPPLANITFNNNLKPTCRSKESPSTYQPSRNKRSNHRPHPHDSRVQIPSSKQPRHEELKQHQSKSGFCYATLIRLLP